MRITEKALSIKREIENGSLLIKIKPETYAVWKLHSKQSSFVTNDPSNAFLDGHSIKAQM